MDPEQERYECTEIFLTSNASKSEVARLGHECLQLAKEFPLTDPECPWLTNEDGVKWRSMAILPIYAANRAHFYLEAMTFDSGRRDFWSGDSCAFSVLEKVIKLIEDHPEVDKINDSVEKRAARLTAELDKQFSIELKDFSVEWALEMFGSTEDDETRMKSVAISKREKITFKHLRGF
ncbi:hypothetical protein BT96DRAFT_1017767 [Gymnopus androsaceus JB14]|uniref:Uncharacterized protein n=1 Tax=Gymnopus androsaceus JB14 TaxID=1447944 RepID=A0A6A4HYC4_9AGAR|nr:hypothetical protein BT96DRAFT_1017767 [Gymnopus androsaceus JB14]